jgi:hypothetical protein
MSMEEKDCKQKLAVFPSGLHLMATLLSSQNSTCILVEASLGYFVIQKK